ncbi:MAG: hypothetical protein ACT4P7_12115 [Gemmatimonadaceae bacterium]
MAPVATFGQGTRVNPNMFVAVDWGATMDSVKARAEAAGWSFTRVDDDSDYVFRGTLGEQEAVVYATFGSRGLTRLTFGIAPHPIAPITYQRLADSVAAHYGTARLVADDEGRVRPAPMMMAAAAWPGLMMGLRRDGWINLIFTCPETSPRLPEPTGPTALKRTSGG